MLGKSKKVHVVLTTDRVAIEENDSVIFSTNNHRVIGLCRHCTVRNYSIDEDAFNVAKLV